MYVSDARTMPSLYTKALPCLSDNVGHTFYSWRGRMQVALHSPWIHIIIVALVVADALIVVFELLLDVGAFGKVYIIIILL